MVITQFRKELFKLVDRAAAGELIEFTYRGQIFQLVPKDSPKTTKLGRITPLSQGLFVNGPAGELVNDTHRMAEKIMDEWDAKWAAK